MTFTAGNCQVSYSINSRPGPASAAVLTTVL
jgi:hypothetical protein